MSSGFTFTDGHATPWRRSDVAEGVEVKDLGSVDARSMQLVRFAPGTRFPAHVHTGPEFVYLVEGEAYQDGQKLTAGWGAAAATGTRDDEFHSPRGCTFLTVYSE